MTAIPFTLASAIFALASTSLVASDDFGKQRLDVLTNLPSLQQFQRTVSINRPNICLGRLLEIISEQSGQSLNCDTRDPTSGTRFDVSINNVKVGEIMDCLRSMMSYENQQWQWRSNMDPKNPKYLLKPDKPNSDFREDVEKLVANQLGSQWLAAVNIVNGRWTVEKAVKETGIDPMLLNINPARSAMIRNLGSITNRAPNLPPLALNESVKVDISSFDEADRELVLGYSKNAAGRNSTQPPTFILFKRAVEVEGNCAEIISAMINGRYGGSILGGPMQTDEINTAMDKKWFNSGDELTDPIVELHSFSKGFLFQETPKEFKETNPEFVSDVTGSSFVWFNRLFHGTQSSFLVRKLPNRDRLYLWNGDENSLIGPPLIGISKSAGIPHKWRNHILLATNRTWFLREQMLELAPWHTLAPAELAAETKKWIDLPSIMKSFLQMTEIQRINYCKGHPECLAVIFDWKLFAMLGASELTLRQVITERGGALPDEMYEAFKSSPNGQLKNAALAGELVAIRYLPRPGTETYMNCKEDVFALQVKSNREGWITLSALPIPGVKYPPRPVNQPLPSTPEQEGAQPLAAGKLLQSH